MARERDGPNAGVGIGTRGLATRTGRLVGRFRLVTLPFNDARWDTFGLMKEAFLALDQAMAGATRQVTGIDRSIVDLLIRVARSPEATARPTDLARDLSLVPSNITRCLDEAERRCLVTRGPHPTDRRSKLVVLAPAGEALLRELEPHFAEVQQQLIHGLIDERETATLETLLRRLRDAALERE